VSDKSSSSLAHIPITGPITDERARDVCAAIDQAWNYYQYRELTIILSSEGGALSAMDRVLRAIDSCQAHGIVVRTVCDGAVASAAAVIASASTPGRREATSHARLLYHEPRVALGEAAHAQGALEAMASALSLSADRVIETLVSRAPSGSDEPDIALTEIPAPLRSLMRDGTGTDTATLRDVYRHLLRLDMWLTPTEACRLRLVDRCVPEVHPGAKRP
jgi:ATP-dependent protease ClpP protease subunit